MTDGFYLCFSYIKRRSGTALTFVTREDWGSAHKLVSIMVEANQEVPDWLVSMADRYKAYRERMREDGQGKPNIILFLAECVFSSILNWDRMMGHGGGSSETNQCPILK